MKPSAKIAVIGGSGVYEIEGISNIKHLRVRTPFGDPSDAITLGDIGETRVAFLPRHSRGHKLLPSEVNSRANIYALKLLGVEHIISVSACGSLREELRPRDFIIPDQLYDKTKNRASTFFGKGIVGHIGFADPYCADLGRVLGEAAGELGIKAHSGGTYVCIEGPQFSTRAESEVHRKLGFSVVGMTNIPEAKLAREAEICYATVAQITDYDVWKEGSEVTISEVAANMNANVENVKRLVKAAVPRITGERKCLCSTAAKYAVFTRKSAINKATLKKLRPIIGKYL
jgi:5'-methylthioadenosine phosphorylase